jgi:hypothetical protein
MVYSSSRLEGHVLAAIHAMDDPGDPPASVPSMAPRAHATLRSLDTRSRTGTRSSRLLICPAIVYIHIHTTFAHPYLAISHSASDVSALSLDCRAHLHTIGCPAGHPDRMVPGAGRGFAAQPITAHQSANFSPNFEPSSLSFLWLWAYCAKNALCDLANSSK